MSLSIKDPWKKQRSKSSSQRMTPQSKKKETQTGLDIDSDAESHENSTDDDDDEEVNTLSPEKKKLADNTDSHKKIIDLWKKTNDPGREKRRPRFKRKGPALEEFEAQYKEVSGASGDDSKTLLHLLAKGMTTSLKYLVRWLLETYPDLILERDSENHTALSTAIASQNVIFANEVWKHSQNKVEALQQTSPGGTGGTCLHKALELVNSTPSITGVVESIIKPIIKLLGDDQDIQAQGDGKASSPMRSVIYQRDHQGNTPLHIALANLAGCSARGDQETEVNSLINFAMKIIQKYPEIMYERNKTSKTPYDRLGSAKEMEACAKLVEEIKKGIMRNSTHDETINLLYADSRSELTIFFDITQFAGRKIIPITELDGSGTHVKFESILQHVDLPNLTISGGDDLLATDSSDSETSSDIYALRSRLDYVKVFNWLRKKGGVRKVLEANVEDDETEPHCDEAIEMALQGLDVEILNWKKLDLCSDVLCKAASNVKELFLYSSANNDVLQNWSTKDGLGRLQKLEKLHLSIRESQTTEKRIAEYRRNFRERLKENCPKIILYDEKGLWNKHVNNSSSHGDFDTGSRHPWLDCMYNFAMIVRNNHERFKNPAYEVRVAIIDDGIDDRLAIFKERIARGKSFLKRPDRSDRTIDYWIRPGGHGTQMAKLICQIFPCARLYIIRLDEGVGEKGERQIRIDSATKAVEWATRNSVDIISMSWSIHEPDAKSTKRKEFEDSIKKAHEKDITMFCTASDHGRNAESAAANDLPAAFLYPIKIGAATAANHESAQVGYESVDFYLPGHKIALDDHQSAKEQAQSGSSLATAVAAGLAALLQYCNSIAKCGENNSQALGTTQTKQAFKQLCASTRGFPEVVRIFGDTKNLDRPNEVMAKYKKIVDELQIS